MNNIFIILTLPLFFYRPSYEDRRENVYSSEPSYPAALKLNLLKKVKPNFGDKKKPLSLLIIEHAFQELVLHRGLALGGKRNKFREDVDGTKNFATKDKRQVTRMTSNNACNQEESWNFRYLLPI